MKLRRLVYAAVSFVGGFLLLIPLGWFFDAMQWPAFNSRTLWTMTFPVAWAGMVMIVFLVCYLLDPRMGAE